MLDFYLFDHLQKYTEVLHVVTTKSSDLPYAFSLALHTGEDRAEIIANRNKLSKLLNTNKELHYIVANQTHSDHIKVIQKQENKGWESLEDAIEDCDALITNVEGLVLCILTADCVPVLLYDKNKNVVAAIHAGWKGTQAQIVTKTVQKMTEVFGSNPKDILAGIAPSIGSCCYEVGEDVAGHFFKSPEAFTKQGEKYMLNLPYLNQQQLLDAGVEKANIEMSSICTACEVERFFSYRKEKGCSGRFMSMIGLTSS